MVLIPLLLLFPMWQSGVYAQRIETTVHFELDKYEHVVSLHNNSESYRTIDYVLGEILADSTYIINRIVIRGNTSPEAGVSYNKTLSQNRANAISSYITSTHQVSPELITAVGDGIQWDYLYELVSDSDMEYRDEILEILTSVEEETWCRVNPGDKWMTLTDSRLKHLMELRGGKPYRSLLKEIFPLMRNSSLVTILYSHSNLIDMPAISHEIPIIKQDIAQCAPVQPGFESQSRSAGYAFAVKSNLINDLMTVTNVELEFPMGQRFSLTGEYTFPWWYGAKSNFTMRTQMFHVGANYWLGDRTQREVLTGWHIGAMVGYANKYDVQLLAQPGIQGDYKMAGLNVGYAHTLYKSLRLEYQLGLGVMRSDYRNYTMAYDTIYDDIKVFDYPWEVKRKTWIGPTQARVSLVWLINFQKGGRDEN